MARHCTSLLVGLFLLGAGCGDQKDTDESQEEEEANPWVDSDGGLDADGAVDADIAGDDGTVADGLDADEGTTGGDDSSADVDVDGGSDGDSAEPDDDSAAPVDGGIVDTGDTASPGSGPVGTDMDGDGVSLEAGDCDDDDPLRYPGNAEVCDGIDNDCDGEVDGPDPVDGTSWYADFDRDSWGDSEVKVVSCERPVGYAPYEGDCNDIDDSVFPGAAEVCDLADNDCDGLTDEDPIVGTTYFRDGDGDGYGDPEMSAVACLPPVGYVEDDSDCKDSDASVNPDGTESCNGVDDDCDGSVDDGFTLLTWYADDDGDGRGDPMSVTLACYPPAGHVDDRNDCNDADATMHGDMVEMCDTKDNDCDGEIDEDLVDIVFYRDRDGDGYGTDSDIVMDCSAPSGYVVEGDDCDDDNSEVRPGRTEACNGVDDNCNSVIDEGWPLDDYFYDGDGDGHGAGSPTEACEPPVDHVLFGDDCDDTDATINPSITADCEDGRDDDCDGTTDDGPYDAVFYRDLDGDGFGDLSRTTIGCEPEDGWVWDNTDCDDSDPDVYPADREDCGDPVDNDCDGLDDESDPDCDCPDHGYREDFDLGSEVGDAVATGTTADLDETYSGDCGSSGGLDAFYRFRAPEDGCYTFDTESSTYDTVLRLFEACEGVSLECDDDGGSGTTSRIEYALDEGQEVFVVVDGYSAGSMGEYTLSIDYTELETSEEPGTAVEYDEDLDDATGSRVASGSSIGMGDDFTGTCGSTGGEDVAHLWEAPSAGCWAFSTEGSSFDTLLRLYDADGGGGGGVSRACGADSTVSDGSLDCDDDGGLDLTSVIRYTATAGERLVVVVDGYSSGAAGDYFLSIEEC